MNRGSGWLVTFEFGGGFGLFAVGGWWCSSDNISAGGKTLRVS